MRKKAIPLVLAIAVVLLAGAVAVWAVQPAATGKWEGLFDSPIRQLVLGHVGRFLVLKSQLDVSADQKRQIREIVMKHRGEIVPVAKALVEKRRALGDTVLKEGADEKAIRAAAQELTKSVGDAAVLASRVVKEIRPVLTAKQVDLITEFKANNQKATLEWLDQWAGK